MIKSTNFAMKTTAVDASENDAKLIKYAIIARNGNEDEEYIEKYRYRTPSFLARAIG